MPPEWTCTLKPDQGGKQDASLCGSQAKQGVLLRPQASNKSQSSKQAKLNTATSINAKRQRAFRASFHPNQPSHVLTFARKLTESQRGSRLHSKECDLHRNPSNLFASSLFQQHIASVALGAFRHLSPKTLGPYETNQRPGPKP